MMKSKPKFVILAAGLGTRVAQSSRGFNKGLLPINGQAAISYILDKVPTDLEIVLIINPVDGPILKEYCLVGYPDRKFKFVIVENYKGYGAGPGHSLWCAKSILQCPFYICTVDCLPTQSIPKPGNWVGVSLINSKYEADNYSSVKIDPVNKVTAFKDKSDKPYDYAFSGLACITEYKKFWELLVGSLDNKELGFIGAWFYPDEYKSLTSKTILWQDIGSEEKYKEVLGLFGDTEFGLKKINDEQSYYVNGTFIKISQDKKTNLDRINKFKQLKPFSPELCFEGEYVLAYKWLKGDTLYNYNQFYYYKAILSFCKRHLWSNKDQWGCLANDREESRQFYLHKTFKRLLKCPKDYIDKLTPMLLDLNWDYLTDCSFAKIHGDLQFDNILLISWVGEPFDGFKLLDPRGSFGNNKLYGDIHYDLAKLYASSWFSFRDLADGKCRLNEICLPAWPVNKELMIFHQYFKYWLVNNRYDLLKVKQLACIVLINMAPLHPEPIASFLLEFAYLKLKGSI